MKPIIVIGLFALLLGAAIVKTIEERREHKEALEQEKKIALGHPAGPTEIEHDGVYFVRASMIDVWPERTNNLSVLQKVTVLDHSDYQHSSTNRLFRLPWSLEQGYYIFFRNGTNLSYLEIPPPKKP